MNKKNKNLLIKLMKIFDKLGFHPEYGDSLEFNGIKLIDENTLHFFDGWTQEELDE